MGNFNYYEHCSDPLVSTLSKLLQEKMLECSTYQQLARALISEGVTIKDADAVEVKLGTWRLETDEEMPNPMFKLVVCSCCGERANNTYAHCPGCGAKMIALELESKR